MKLYFIFACLAVLFIQNIASLEITSAERAINVTTQLSRQQISFSLENNDKDAVSSFVVAFRRQAALVSASTDEANLQVSHVNVESNDNQEYFSYTVTLSEALKANENLLVNVEAIFSKTQTPLPANIQQKEKQSVIYTDNHFIFSPYTIKTQETTVVLPEPGRIEANSELAPTTVSGNEIKYGPYTDVEAFSYDKLSVHFENNNAFFVISSIEKEIEVSHWGNVAVEAAYKIEHTGAGLKGAFSRLDHQQGYVGNSINSFEQYLPEGASDVYYRDVIGNISTSNLWVNEDNEVHFVFKPRFTMFGGWKTEYYMGYNLPASQYLGFSSSGQHVLNVPFGVNFTDASIDELVVKVILPEGSKNIQVHAPLKVDALDDTVRYTYLDTTGRPVVAVRARNIVSDNAFFQVTYDVTPFSLLREPIILISAYMCGFIIMMVFVRFNLSITKFDVEQLRRASDRFVASLKKVTPLFKKQDNLRKEFDAALNQYVSSSSENNKAYTKAANKFKLGVEGQSKQAQALANDLESSPVMAGRLREADRLEKTRTALQLEMHKLTIRNKIKKTVDDDAFNSDYAAIQKEYTAAKANINALLSELTADL